MVEQRQSMPAEQMERHRKVNAKPLQWMFDQAKIKTAQDAAAGSNVFGLGANTGSGFTANLQVNLDGKTIAQSTDSYLGRQAQNSGNSRLYP